MVFAIWNSDLQIRISEVHGSGPLLSNLCKSIAIDDDDEAPNPLNPS